jgi:NAD(P)-dependent dehydrogenase (short-subunit alcohol dehydrogenase family)
MSGGAAVQPTYPDLAGRAVLITGGADGIGRAIAEAFLAQGSQVAILDVSPDAIDKLRASHPSVHTARVDLRDVAATRNAIQRLSDALGPFTVLVNNAGNDERHAFEDVDEAYWDDRMAVNLRHMMFAAQAVAPGMGKLGGGSIVNLGSTSWMQGAVGLIAYTTAKAATIGFTRSLARELGPHHIRVNCLTPGWVMTARQRTRWATPERLAAAQAKQCIPGEILPDDVAALALFLASDVSRMCTGQNFIVDAGVV